MTGRTWAGVLLAAVTLWALIYFALFSWWLPLEVQAATSFLVGVTSAMLAFWLMMWRTR